MRAALCASRWEFFLRGLRFSAGLGWGGQEVRNSPGVDPMITPVFLEYDSVDGGKKRHVLHVVLEFVAAALGGATEFASPDLRLGASRRDPRVALGTKHTGSHGGGGGFGEGDGFLELVVEYGSLLAGFVSVSEETVYSGASRTGEVVGEEGGFEPFRRGRMGRSFFLFGSALDNSAPRGVRYGLAGFEEIVGKRRARPTSCYLFLAGRLR